MSLFHEKHKEPVDKSYHGHDDELFRSLAIYTQSTDHRDKFSIHYIDSEWNDAGGSGSGTTNGGTQLDKIKTFFGDSITWSIKDKANNFTGTVKFLLVRTSDRKMCKVTITCSGVHLRAGTITVLELNSAWTTKHARLRLLGYC
jgi:hypothetical protein